jgi:peptidoglycan hydrolase-like protein with peptidoglycan-binding domain
METSNTSTTSNATVTPTASGINMPVLKQGDSGEAVRFLEQLLIRRYGYNSIVFDGNFNTSTTQAVKNFQTTYGLVSDGIVGKMTWRALSGNV